MKKITAGLSLVAAVGFTGLAASPAMAAPFQNCEQAALANVYNIQFGSPLYVADQDRDNDGVACENGDYGLYQDVATTTPVPTNTAPVTQAPQVVQAPVGGVATGVAQDTTDNTAALALGAGFVLAAVAGGTFVVRRRGAQA